MDCFNSIIMHLKILRSSGSGTNTGISPGEGAEKINSKRIKILLVVMLAVSVLFFLYLYNTSNTIDLLKNLKTLSKPDPLWFMKSTISNIVDTILDVLKKILGTV